MFIEKQWCVLSASATLALGLSVALVACDRDPPNTNTGGNGVGGEGLTTTTSSSSSGSGNAGGTGGASGGSGGGGAGGMGLTCDGSVVTIEQITNPKAAGFVNDGAPVQVKGAVAMSQKFLVSKGSTSGTCLFGVFVSAPGLTETKEYSGIMVVSKGSDAVVDPMDPTKSFCGKISNRFGNDPPPGDSIPDDIKPGDVVDVIGVADYFLLTSFCTKPTDSKVAQRQIAFACKVEKTGTATPPTPHVFTTPEDVAKLASTTDTAFHDMWGGVKVRVGIESTPVPQPDPGGGPGMVVTNKFGEILLTTSNLRVADKLYYRGYDKQTCYTGPMFSDVNIKWTAIDGFSYLNFCTWDLEPSNKCADFNPASEDCTNVTCPPP